MNLCANAAHSMSEKGGVLEVSLATTELNPEIAALHQDIKSGTYLKITVRDTGNGINPAIIDRIFDPFFTTKEKGEGTVPSPPSTNRGLISIRPRLSSCSTAR